jgi:hypothetical membrane protein
MTRAGLRYLALGGIAGPALFTLTTVISACLRSGYSHKTQFISDLGATGSPNANLMNYAGFIPSGILAGLFGLSLFLLLPKKMITVTGSVLVTVFGIGMVVAGIYSNDAPGFQGEGSLSNRIHDQVSGLMFLCVIAGILILGLSFRKIPSWRGLWIYSVLSSPISLILFITFINSMDSHTYTGMWQRLFLLSVFLWMAIVGWHNFKNQKSWQIKIQTK